MLCCFWLLFHRVFVNDVLFIFHRNRLDLLLKRTNLVLLLEFRNGKKRITSSKRGMKLESWSWRDLISCRWDCSVVSWSLHVVSAFCLSWGISPTCSLVSCSSSSLHSTSIYNYKRKTLQTLIGVEETICCSSRLYSFWLLCVASSSCFRSSKNCCSKSK